MKIRIYGKIDSSKEAVYLLTALVDFPVRPGMPVKEVQINGHPTYVDCEVKETFTHFGSKKILKTEIEKGSKGLITLSQRVAELEILPDVQEGWEIDQDNEVFIFLENS